MYFGFTYISPVRINFARFSNASMEISNDTVRICSSPIMVWLTFALQLVKHAFGKFFYSKEEYSWKFTTLMVLPRQRWLSTNFHCMNGADLFFISRRKNGNFTWIADRTLMKQVMPTMCKANKFGKFFFSRKHFKAPYFKI